MYYMYITILLGKIIPQHCCRKLLYWKVVSLTTWRRWFQELIKKTDDSHPERRSLEKALEAMQVSTVYAQYSGRINYNYVNKYVCNFPSALKEFHSLQNNFQDLSLYVNEVKRDDEALQLINEIQHSIVDLAMVRNVSFSSTTFRLL